MEGTMKPGDLARDKWNIIQTVETVVDNRITVVGDSESYPISNFQEVEWSEKERKFVDKT
jgi:hypothetical protein